MFLQKPPLYAVYGVWRKGLQREHVKRQQKRNNGTTCFSMTKLSSIFAFVLSERVDV